MIEVQPTRSQAILVTIIGAIAVGGASWLAISSTNGASFWSPGPLLMILPAWLIAETLLGNIDLGPVLVPYMGSLLFFLLGVPLTSPRSTVVLPSIIFCGFLVLGSIAFFGVGWNSGVQYQGLAYTFTLATINLIMAALAIWLALKAYGTRTYANRFALTFQICTWFVWFAFPWLGEMI